MDDAGFLAEPCGPGMTVVALGLPERPVIAQILCRIGTTGLFVIGHPSPHRATDGAAHVRAAISAMPVLSHVADVALVAAGTSGAAAGALVDEVRRLLAPRGVTRLLLSKDELPPLVTELERCRFRGVRWEASATRDVLVHALGPR